MDNPTNPHKLLALLEAHNVPLSEWGKGEAKTFEHLVREVEEGEATVTLEGNTLLRTAYGSMVKVFYQNREQLLYLKEDRQVFHDGRVKKRHLSSSIGEKIRPEESPIEAAFRALKEELKIVEQLPLRIYPQEKNGPIASSSYPGLKSLYFIHMFEVYLPTHLYKPEGYIEVQNDKTNYYVWVLHNSVNPA